MQFYIRVEAGDEGANGSISNLKIEVNNYTELLIPTTFKPKDRLYSDGEKVYLCDTGWKVIKDLEVKKLPNLKSGENSLAVMCDFNGNKPRIEMAFKTVDNPEMVVASTQ